MLSNIKRKKIIGGLLALSMIVSLTPGCGSNSSPNDKEKDKEDDSGHSSFIYPWWLWMNGSGPFPIGSGTTSNISNTSNTTKSSVTKPINTTTSKVQSAGSGKLVLDLVQREVRQYLKLEGK